MAKAHSPEAVQHAIDLRRQGKSINQVVAITGMSRTVVIRYTKLPDQRRTTHAPQNQAVIEDVDEYADVQPMWPYPDDLPDLQLDPMNWTAEELALMGEWSREILFFEPIL